MAIQQDTLRISWTHIFILIYRKQTRRFKVESIDCTHTAISHCYACGNVSDVILSLGFIKGPVVICSTYHVQLCKLIHNSMNAGSSEAQFHTMHAVLQICLVKPPHSSITVIMIGFCPCFPGSVMTCIHVLQWSNWACEAFLTNCIN